jgi:hypothetical protein
MHPGKEKYNRSLDAVHAELCDFLANEIGRALPEAENKIWHAHPVWFLDGNPVAGYSKQKPGVRLMFWSGAGFEEARLSIRGQKFKDASIFLDDVSGLKTSELRRWLKKARDIQWD